MELSFDQYKLLVKEYIHDFIEAGHAESTKRQKEDLHRRVATFLAGRPFNLENVKAFQQFIYENGCKEKSSRARHASELRVFVRWCFRYKDLFDKDWSFKIIKPDVHLLSEENALRVIIEGCKIEPFHNSRIRKAKNEHLLALELILLQGFRVGEVIGMQGNDVKLDADIPYIRLKKPKSQEEEWQPIHSHFMPILRERLNNEKLFSITDKTCNKLLHKGAESLGLVGYDNTVHIGYEIFMRLIGFVRKTMDNLFQDPFVIRILRQRMTIIPITI